MTAANTDINYSLNKLKPKQHFYSDCLEEHHSPVLQIGTPPLDEIQYVSEQNNPFSCIYLLNLFLAPDMALYLQQTSISDSVYDLPVHMQKLVSEARMEALLMKQERLSKSVALEKLKKVRSYISTFCGHDSTLIINTIYELMKDEDELSCIIGE